VINLYINERRHGDVTVLDLKGRLRVGGNTVALHKSISCLAGENRLLILLNLADVLYIDSCGLGELVAGQISLENKGGKMKLVGLTQPLRELLTVTRLLTVFDIYEKETDAIQDLVDQISRSEKPRLAFV